jgi:hypothetical protein
VKSDMLLYMITRNALIVSVSVVLLLVSVALVLVSGKNVEQEKGVAQQNGLLTEEVVLTNVNGIPIRYVIKDKVIFSGAEIDVWTEWIDDTCRLEIEEGYSRSLSPRRLAELVAGCHTQLMVKEFGTSKEAGAFEVAYADLYVSRCGDIFQPLGWKNATDGECELPGFDEINIY